ncbi:NHL repeat containing protein [Pseudopedobacter saltans DSM 12145]|uniref:NHL repeat containing protein n=1 Tax=Pseudopedobacter saltans (strain ATCC 51119 / DSM 12145 / JCM 21818 / CCUG 39354 / LMG 10337 / NBRC 100064 / NCIMB 13643) TaxID=762903 RepID=F0S5D8_PSESL|nr:T9SS type A sorting domain-containing protein [Pseudopedobacter saltans]ADY52083.1 NHL repeat containing protein [Pseudopedobacter saltans DSM 12145]
MKRIYLTLILMLGTYMVTKSQNYTVTTVAGSTTFGFVDGNGLDARFRNPDGILVDMNGDIIITDRTNHSIRKMTTAGVVSTLAGTGVSGYANGKPGQFNTPWQSTVDAAGNIIVVEKDGARIRKIALDGTVSTIAGTGSAGYSDGAVSVARFDNALDAVVDSDGNIFIADRNNRRVRKITPGAGGNWTTATVSTVAGDGTTSGTVVWPISLAIDAADNLFVSDSRTIRMITKTGTISTIVGLQASTNFTDGESGKPLTARLGDVFGLNFDNDGNIIFADASFNRIRKITPGENGDWTTATVTTIAGTGSTGRIDGLGNVATFNQPYDVVTDENGNIYVADNVNHSIRKLVPSPLPVQLSSFTATANNSQVKIQWQTASESNNSHFRILRSSNAQDFTTLGVVIGNGNSTQEMDYHFTDYNPLKGINYYQLEQVDFDGKISLSNIATVNFNIQAKSKLNAYYSADKKLVLELDEKLFEKGFVKVFTITGKEMLSTSINQETVKISLPISLQKGIYVVALNSQGSNDSVKFIVE